MNIQPPPFLMGNKTITITHMKIKNLIYNTEQREDVILSVLRVQLEADLAKLEKDLVRYNKEKLHNEIIEDTLARIADLEDTIAGTHDFEGWLVRAYPTELSDLKVCYSKDGDYPEEEASRMFDSIRDKERRHEAYRAKAYNALSRMFRQPIYDIELLKEIIRYSGKEAVLDMVENIDNIGMEHIPMEHNYTLAELRGEPLKYLKYKL